MGTGVVIRDDSRLGLVIAIIDIGVRCVVFDQRCYVRSGVERVHLVGSVRSNIEMFMWIG